MVKQWKETHAIGWLDGHAESVRLLLDDFMKTYQQWYDDGEKREGKTFNQVVGKWNLYVIAATHSIEIALKTLVYQKMGRETHPGTGNHDLLPWYERLVKDDDQTREALETVWDGSLGFRDEDYAAHGFPDRLFRRPADGVSFQQVIEKADRWNRLFRYEMLERNVDIEEHTGHGVHLSDAVQALRLFAGDRSQQGWGTTL